MDPVRGEALARYDPKDLRPGRVFLARYHNENSKRAMLQSLRSILDCLSIEGDPLDFPWGDFRYPAAVALRAKLEEKYPNSKRTIAHRMAALSGVLRVAKRLNQISTEDLESITDKGGPLTVNGTDDAPPSGRMLTRDEIDLLINSPNAFRDTAKGRRDSAILAIAIFGGLRRAEIAALDVADIDRGDSSRGDRGDDSRGVTITVRKGKGDKTRTVVLAPDLNSIIDRYIDARGTSDGALFFGARRGYALDRRSRITAEGIYYVIRSACAVLGSPAGPHDMRRTFASTLIDLGVDIVTVRDLMGHKSVETTARYDRRGEARKHVAAAKLGAVLKPPDAP